jgi:hypothetical protein
MNKPICLPHFLNDSTVDLVSVPDLDWLTDELQKEIMGHYPLATDINGGDNRRCKASFEKHALELFPSGRRFASYVQLREAVELFLKAWGASGSHGSSRISCFYGKASKSQATSVVLPDKQRVRGASLKEQQCPFKIRYSFQGKIGPEKKHNIYYHVKITSVDYNHTCELAPESLRLALKSSCKLIPDLTGLQDVISILREHPHLDHRVLRTLLQKFVPFYQSIDGTFIRNFRLRAMNYLDNDHDLTMVEARALTSKSKSASDELVSFDNPMFAKNFKLLLQKTMQDDGTTWEAIAYLRTLTNEVVGFGYRVKYDSIGRPEAICWMLPHMRTNLLRYGNVLFLDSMKKEYNKLAWPYIGPTVKDGEMKIRQVAECIAIEEKLDIYQFVIESLTSIESRWGIEELRIIFADQFLTQTLVENLGIVDTCTLRCDYHHVVNEVWPLEFGISVWKDLKPYLTRMLKSRTKEEYKLSFDIAMETVLEDPRQQSYIEKIFNNPQYYAGYHLRQMNGNLKMMGSAPAEQNHSSISMHLGHGANWSVAENIRQLIERQQTLEKSFSHYDNKLYTTNLNFRSDLVGRDKYNEEAAKRNLTKYAFDNLFCRARSKARELSIEVEVDGSVCLWPHYKDKQDNATITIAKDVRCDCADRIAYQFQCCHELAADKDFTLDKYNPRWLMTKVFRKKFPLVCQLPIRGGISDEGLVDVRENTLNCQPMPNNNSNDNCMEEFEQNTSEGCGIEDESDHVEHPDNTQDERTTHSTSNNFSYKFLLSRCSELCRTTGHDKTAMAAVVSLVDEATERLRMGLHISPTWTDIMPQTTQASLDGSRNQQPLPAIPAHHTKPTTQHRFKSSVEMSRNRKRKSTPLMVLPLQPIANTGRKNPGCSLCFQRGHKVGRCPSLDSYKGLPLAKKDVKARTDLAISLSQPNVYATQPKDVLRPEGCVVHITLPTRFQALIIHRRMLMDNSLLLPNVPENFCLEVTLLHEGGVEHVRFTKKLFELGCITQYIQKSQQNIIISELRTSSSNAMVYQPGFLSQASAMSQPPMSQTLDDTGPLMGYGMNDTIPAMGYGFGGYTADI